MAIELRQVEMNESLNDPIDGVTERKYLVESLSTSWHRSINLAELRAIVLDTSHEKIHHARLVFEFRRRQRSYHELLRDGTAVAATRAKVDHEKDVKDKVQQLIDTLGNNSMPKESGTSMQEEVLCRSLAAIRENSYIAQSMWEALSHTTRNEHQTLGSTSHEALHIKKSCVKLCSIGLSELWLMGYTGDGDFEAWTKKCATPANRHFTTSLLLPAAAVAVTPINAKRRILVFPQALVCLGSSPHIIGAVAARAMRTKRSYLAHARKHGDRQTVKWQDGLDNDKIRRRPCRLVLDISRHKNLAEISVTEDFCLSDRTSPSCLSVQPPTISSEISNPVFNDILSGNGSDLVEALLKPFQLLTKQQSTPGGGGGGGSGRYGEETRVASIAVGDALPSTGLERDMSSSQALPALQPQLLPEEDWEMFKKAEEETNDRWAAPGDRNLRLIQLLAGIKVPPKDCSIVEAETIWETEKLRGDVGWLLWFRVGPSFNSLLTGFGCRLVSV
ncbi:hypothetical protein LX36DRAFT_672296 [Colletotrichum falcatum]|nr:hypothetical protein LX36DRAFT_672296 [Colletotrichum falcatum]